MYIGTTDVDICVFSIVIKYKKIPIGDASKAMT